VLVTNENADSPVPADASTYVHVLDMVVEAEKTSTVE
jgi:hypothetical protein